MLKNYARVAGRNLAKRKFFSALNIGGLAIGMAISLLIFQYAAYETGFDRHVEDADRTFRVTATAFRNGVHESKNADLFHAMAPVIEAEIPAVENLARLHTATATIRLVAHPEATMGLEHMAYVDPAFFDLMSYSRLRGDPAAALAEPGGVVVTESEALRLYGRSDVLGQSVEVYGWVEQPGVIRAVVHDPPGPTHIRATLFQSIEDLLTNTESQYAETDGWSWSNFNIYVRLAASADPDAVPGDIDRAMSTASDRWVTDTFRRESGLQPIRRVHLFNDFDDAFAPQGAYRRVAFISIIGLFVLLIAWLNYVNLSTARAMERAKEVGVRKASGARRSQVVSQFVLESALVNTLALLIALVVADRMLPWLSAVAGISVGSSDWLSARLWVMLLVVFGVGSVVASFYPALIISAFNPATILKSGHSHRQRTGLRKVLVVFQFAMSIALLSGTLIVYSQMNHLRSLHPGFDLDQVLVVERPAVVDEQEAYTAARSAFLDHVRSNPRVSNLSLSTTVPGNDFNLGSTGRRQTAEPEDRKPVNAFWIGDGFLDTYGIRLMEGRSLTSERPGDFDAVLLNPAAVDALGFSSAADAVGQRVVLGRSTEFDVVGVTEDFAWMSKKTQSPPVMIALTDGGAYFSMKLIGGSIAETLDQIERAYKGAFPGNAFNYEFADERFDALYRDEERLSTLVSAFAIFALLVASLGLLGLAALTASQRRKEISVRKVLGASSWAVSRLLTGDFAMLVTLGLVLAVPATWIAAGQWLSRFANHVEPGIWTFLAPAGLVLTVAMGASAFHVWRAAVSSPVEGIRAG